MKNTKSKTAQKKRQAENATALSPLSQTEVIERFNLAADERVPEKLGLIEQPEILPYKRMFVTRDKRTRIKATALEPMRPAWMASVPVPKKAPLPFRPRKIEHRGQLIEPGLVFAPDDRRTYFDRSYPWGCVCKVITAMGWGSGTIVGPRHVLTASHVVDWTRDGAGSVEVHRAGGSVAATTRIAAVWAYTRVTGTIDWSENDEDYAVLVTDSRIGDRFGWLGTRTYDSGWDGDAYWYSFGYPGDIGGGSSPVWQRRKWLDEDGWDLGGGRSMTTDADLIPGQSGSPMFAWWAPGPYVVAVWSGFTSSENWCSGGSDMTHLVVHARAHDP